MELTHGSKTLLFKLYRTYKERRSEGLSESKSRSFGSSALIQKTISPDISFEDVDEYIRELSRNNFCNVMYADSCVYHCELSPYAIYVLETLPKENLLSIAEFISKFIP